jgi:hypothetical protein
VREITLFDHGIRPHGTYESVLCDQAAVVRYQGKKGVEHLCPERHWLPVSQQAALAHLKAKRTELVDLAGALHFSDFRNTPRVGFRLD